MNIYIINQTTLIDRKISLYQKALEYNPYDIRLIKGLMDLASNVLYIIYVVL